MSADPGGETKHVDSERRERMYLLREGHLFGYCFGVWLGSTGNLWACFGWLAVLLVLWTWSLWKAPRPAHIGRGPDDE